jgi:integrase
VAREWHELLYRHEVVPKQAERTLRRLELYVFPKLGAMPIEEIEPADILPVLRAIEHTGRIDTAHRTRTALSAVFRYAIATGERSATRPPIYAACFVPPVPVIILR